MGVNNPVKLSLKLSTLSTHPPVHQTKPSVSHFKTSTKSVVLVLCQLVVLKPVPSKLVWLLLSLPLQSPLKSNPLKCIIHNLKLVNQVTTSVSTLKTSPLKTFVVVTSAQTAKTIPLKKPNLSTRNSSS